MKAQLCQGKRAGLRLTLPSDLLKILVLPPPHLPKPSPDQPLPTANIDQDLPLRRALAMLTRGHANIWDGHLPIGRTPAVCLTQGLPPEEKANILLLGCGDLRNILFTAYCDGKWVGQRGTATF